VGPEKVHSYFCSSSRVLEFFLMSSVLTCLTYSASHFRARSLNSPGGAASRYLSR
jgi:hypothetical protein